MKNINKIILGILAVALTIASCERDEDKNPLSVNLDEANKAAFVRTVVNQYLYLVEDIKDASFEATVDVPVDNVAQYDLSFTLRSGSGEYDTIPLITITEFPTSISYTYAELCDLIGISIDDIGGGDFFQFIGTCIGKDGRFWTASNFTGDITGQLAQRNGFAFGVLVDCAPITDVETGGTWLVEMQDSFGDGWNGATLVFSIDGATTAYTISADQGAEATHEPEVPSGAVLEIFYTNGEFDSENTFQLYSPDGEFYGDYGPSPGKCVN
ncbi:hypothetical protein [Eudoraea adriatica]|uniref:hypothetical protein n=1 Tax=Eudoraea adriatica TaxID=446681 RepID=UPI0012F8C67D|nr:hypothetical protein [Eudoraea adriatica]